MNVSAYIYKVGKTIVHLMLTNVSIYTSYKGI